MIVPRLACMACVLLMTVYMPAADQPTTVPAERSFPICIAILEPEVLADMPAEQRKALAGAIDTLLTESLATQKGFVLVDRQALDKVLDEHKALAGGAATASGAAATQGATDAGITMLTADQIAEPLRQFWSAGVIICPVVRHDKGKEFQLVLGLEAVAAQSGQLLAQVVETGVWKNGQWAGRRGLAPVAEDLIRQIGPGLVRSCQPLVEVAAGSLDSDPSRLQWMVDDLGDALRADVAGDEGVVLLIARHAASTKEERLLRLMGLSGGRPGDAAAALSPVPAGRVGFTLKEQFSVDVPYKGTPITLKLTWQAGAAKQDKQIAGTVGQWEQLRASAIRWARGMRRNLGPAGGERESSSAEALAAAELDQMRRWESLRFSSSPLENQRRRCIAMHAMRAAHLDPTNEQAAYAVAVNVGALYAEDNHADSLACHNRVIAECQRYIDRFGKKSTSERLAEVRNALALAAFSCEHLVAERRGLALSSRQNGDLYNYANIYVPIWFQRDVDDAVKQGLPVDSRGNLWASTWMLRLDLIMNCPADELDEQYAHWKTFWADRVSKLKGDLPPWQLVEVFFQIRYKDWQKVRQAYQSLAKRYDASVDRIWRYGRTPVLPHTLRAARDPDWSTWRPDFSAKAQREVNMGQFESEIYIFDAPFVNDSPTGPMLPVSKIIPRSEEVNGGRGITDFLAVTGDQLWLVAPSASKNNPSPSKLYVMPVPPDPPNALRPLNSSYWLGPKAVPIDVDAQPVDWPAQQGKKVEPAAACVHATKLAGRNVLLVGTAAHGLARFDRGEDGQWTGQWYAGKEGMPASAIDSVCTWKADGHDVWLVSGRDAAKVDSNAGAVTQQGAVWTINPADGSIQIIFRGDYEAFTKQLKTGPHARELLATVVGAAVAAGAADKADLETVLDAERLVKAAGRLWRIGDGSLTALSADTFGKTAEPIGGRVWWTILPVKEPRRTISLFGNMYLRWGTEQATFDWPAQNILMAVAWKDSIVMVLAPQAAFPDGNHLIAIYRPAPPGSRDWPREDHWEFYSAPERSTIRSMRVDESGRLWLSSSAGLLRLNEQQLPSLAKDYAFSRYCTQYWRDGALLRCKEDSLWRRRVVFHVLNRRWDEAMVEIDRAEAAEPKRKLDARIRRHEKLAFMFWRARVLVEKGQLDAAVDIYRQVLTSDLCTPPVELWTRLFEITVLHRAERWRDVIEQYNAALAAFPQLEPKGDAAFDDLARLANEARKKAAASQPAKTTPPTRAFRE